MEGDDGDVSSGRWQIGGCGVAKSRGREEVDEFATFLNQLVERSCFKIHVILQN